MHHISSPVHYWNHLWSLLFLRRTLCVSLRILRYPLQSYHLKYIVHWAWMAPVAEHVYAISIDCIILNWPFHFDQRTHLNSNSKSRPVPSSGNVTSGSSLSGTSTIFSKDDRNRFCNSDMVDEFDKLISSVVIDGGCAIDANELKTWAKNMNCKCTIHLNC